MMHAPKTQAVAPSSLAKEWPRGERDLTDAADRGHDPSSSIVVERHGEGNLANKAASLSDSRLVDVEQQYKGIRASSETK